MKREVAQGTSGVTRSRESLEQAETRSKTPPEVKDPADVTLTRDNREAVSLVLTHACAEREGITVRDSIAQSALRFGTMTPTHLSETAQPLTHSSMTGERSSLYGYGYGGLVLLPFNVHVPPTRATSR